MPTLTVERCKGDRYWFRVLRREGNGHTYCIDAVEGENWQSGVSALLDRLTANYGWKRRNIRFIHR